eukprot:CAMPEP_0170593658 /NCGR_PEP_ID=MMETSP0224-20130122/13573_1 /TAXON_ID=285029 /ORGANISM="Togula jolla, Strain CCCM 725" /LENGTH=258 /DNA_ID=CAMNT_0010917641 /DNA_START=204 /DNA_END=980 /DNA_ORIENTATION=+
MQASGPSHEGQLHAEASVLPTRSPKRAGQKLDKETTVQQLEELAQWHLQQARQMSEAYAKLVDEARSSVSPCRSRGHSGSLDYSTPPSPAFLLAEDARSPRRLARVMPDFAEQCLPAKVHVNPSYQVSPFAKGDELSAIAPLRTKGDKDRCKMKHSHKAKNSRSNHSFPLTSDGHIIETGMNSPRQIGAKNIAQSKPLGLDFLQPPPGLEGYINPEARGIAETRGGHIGQDDFNLLPLNIFEEVVFTRGLQNGVPLKF